MTERCAVVNPMHLVLIFPTICIPHIFSVHYVTLDITPPLPREGLSEFSPLSFLGWWRRWYLLIAQTPASQTLWSLPFISYWGYNLVPISARCLDTNHSRKNIYLYLMIQTHARYEGGEVWAHVLTYKCKCTLSYCTGRFFTFHCKVTVHQKMNSHHLLTLTLLQTCGTQKKIFWATSQCFLSIQWK